MRPLSAEEWVQQALDAAVEQFDDARLAAVQLVTSATVWGTSPTQLDWADVTKQRGGHSWTTTKRHREVLDRTNTYMERHSGFDLSRRGLACACVDTLSAYQRYTPATLDLPPPLLWETRHAMDKGRTSGKAKRAARLAAAPVETQAMDLRRRTMLKNGMPDPGDPLAPKPKPRKPKASAPPKAKRTTSAAPPAMDSIEAKAGRHLRGEIVTDERGRTHHYRQNIGRITHVG